MSNTPDLTKQPPRSARVRLGGYVILPRLLDKCRAEIAGKNGEYHFNCPLDQRFLSFAGIDADALKNEVAKGKGDGEILEWIRSSATHKHSDTEIAAFSAFAEQRVPADMESREFFQGEVKRAAPGRDDIATWFDLLDVDDFASFGGKA
jgi:Domain of unknown function (DUF5069)